MDLCHLKVSAYMDSSVAHKVGVETLFPASTTITGTNAPSRQTKTTTPYDPNTIAKLLPLDPTTCLPFLLKSAVASVYVRDTS